MITTQEVQKKPLTAKNVTMKVVVVGKDKKEQPIKNTETTKKETTKNVQPKTTTEVKKEAEAVNTVKTAQSRRSSQYVSASNGTLSPPLSTSPSSLSSASSYSTLNTPCSTLIHAIGGAPVSFGSVPHSLNQNDLCTHFVFAKNVLEASCGPTLNSETSSSTQNHTAEPATQSQRNSLIEKPADQKRFSAFEKIDEAKKIDQMRLRREGLKWMKKLANGTVTRPPYGDACAYLADLYANGRLGISLDNAKAFFYWVLGSKQSHPYCSYRVAKAYEFGLGTKKDAAKAIQFYRKATALGDSSAMHRLGIILLYGHLGCTRNDREAVSWMKRALSSSGHSNHSIQSTHLLEPTELMQGEVHYELACLYETGTSSAVIQDDNYAFELYEQAAAFGHTKAQYRLGVAYELGELAVTEANPSLSLHFYKLAAENGNLAEAQLALSGWYLTGIDEELSQSETEAYAWARRAADQGLPMAEYAVGHYSEAGIGTRADVNEAMRWYERASKHGCRKAKKKLKEIKRGSSGDRKNSCNIV